MKKVLNRDAVKYIAIFTMLLDHIGWTFLTFQTPLAQAFHIVGRITAPVMCFFIAQGYQYTKDLKKYFIRLFVFALVSQIPWYLMRDEAFLTLSFNMIFTLFLGLLAVFVVDRVQNRFLCVLAVAAICILTSVLNFDWAIYAILWCVFFFVFRNDKSKMYLSFSCVSVYYFLSIFLQYFSSGYPLSNSFKQSVFTLGTFLAIPILEMYNGQKGRFKSSKWIFYVFYPLHMLILGLIANLV